MFFSGFCGGPEEKELIGECHHAADEGSVFNLIQTHATKDHGVFLGNALGFSQQLRRQFGLDDAVGAHGAVVARLVAHEVVEHLRETLFAFFGGENQIFSGPAQFDSALGPTALFERDQFRKVHADRFGTRHGVPATGRCEEYSVALGQQKSFVAQRTVEQVGAALLEAPGHHFLVFLLEDARTKGPQDVKNSGGDGAG